MAQPALRPATYEDLLALPDGVTGEILFGQLSTQPRPRMRHGHACSRLGARLGKAFDDGDSSAPGGWVIIIEPEVHHSGHVAVPDIAGWRRERMPEVPDTAFSELAPDWVCEVLSPSTAKRDRGAKMDAYAEMGVAHAWLVDVDLKTLEAYRLVEGRWSRLGAWSDDAVVSAEPFDSLALPLTLLWG